MGNVASNNMNIKKLMFTNVNILFYYDKILKNRSKKKIFDVYIISLGFLYLLGSKEKI